MAPIDETAPDFYTGTALNPAPETYLQKQQLKETLINAATTALFVFLAIYVARKYFSGSKTALASGVFFSAFIGFNVGRIINNHV